MSADVLAGPARPTLAAGPGQAGFAGRLRRSVTTVEIAEAAALGDLAAAMCVLTRLVPAGGLGVLLAAFPLAVLGCRRRAQACSIAVVTAFAVAFLGGGVRPAASAVAAGALGSLIGIGLRRGWSVPRLVGTGVLSIGVPASVLAVGILAAPPTCGSWRWPSSRTPGPGSCASPRVRPCPAPSSTWGKRPSRSRSANGDSWCR